MGQFCGKLIDVPGLIIPRPHQGRLLQLTYGPSDSRCNTQRPPTQVADKIQQVITGIPELREVDVIPVGMKIANYSETKRACA